MQDDQQPFFEYSVVRPVTPRMRNTIDMHFKEEEADHDIDNNDRLKLSYFSLCELIGWERGHLGGYAMLPDRTAHEWHTCRETPYCIPNRATYVRWGVLRVRMANPPRAQLPFDNIWFTKNSETAVAHFEKQNVKHSFLGRENAWQRTLVGHIQTLTNLLTPLIGLILGFLRPAKQSRFAMRKDRRFPDLVAELSSCRTYARGINHLYLELQPGQKKDEEERISRVYFYCPSHSLFEINPFWMHEDTQSMSIPGHSLKYIEWSCKQYLKEFDSLWSDAQAPAGRLRSPGSPSLDLRVTVQTTQTRYECACTAHRFGPVLPIFRFRVIDENPREPIPIACRVVDSCFVTAQIKTSGTKRLR